MLQILLSLGQKLQQKILLLSLTILLCVSSLFCFWQSPSYAVTTSTNKLSQDEKIDRAYQFREGTGVLEEDKQASPKRDETFKTTEKANERSATTPRRTNSPLNVFDKAK